MLNKLESPITRSMVVLLVGALLVLVGISGYFVVLDSQERLIHNQATTVAEIVARQAAARSVYSTEIVDKVKADGIGFVDIDYHDKPGAIPLPAQFLKQVSDKASSDSEGLYKYRPVSKWNLSGNQGLNVEFLKSAWAELEKQDKPNPSSAIDWKPTYIVSNVEGKETLLYLKADPAVNESCVSCHNSYERSAAIIERRLEQGIKVGKTWKKHQLLGAIYVQIPIESIKALALKETTHTILWILFILTGGLILLLGFLLSDVTKAKKASDELNWQVDHDRLTELPNRKSFEEKAMLLIENSSNTNNTHAMCYLDLDQFKVVNDTCGHAAGDELLRRISNELKSVINRPNMLARLGGDEFGVLLKNCSTEEAKQIALTLCQKVKSYHFVWNDQAFDIGVSIGVVAINADSEDVDKTMRFADLACYAAKDAGRNRAHVYLENDKEITLRKEEMSWVSRILKALESNRITLYSQKINTVKDHTKVSHYEILVRLIDENGIMVPPGEFLPAAERYDLVSKLDLAIIEKSFEALKNNCFSDLGSLGFISINLSGQSLSNASLLNEVSVLIKKHEINPSKICFEITESSAIANRVLVKEFMKEMKLLGVRFALDDFGTGLSSLTYLKQFPVDYLKIDGSFITDVAINKTDRAVVDAINKLAQTMGLETIAEYVESQEILDTLAELGIDYGQGYFIHKPSPVVNHRNFYDVNLVSRNAA